MNGHGPVYFWRGDGKPCATVHYDDDPPPAKSWTEFQKIAGITNDDGRTDMTLRDNAGNQFEVVSADDFVSRAEFSEALREVERFAKRMDNELGVIAERLPE